MHCLSDVPHAHGPWTSKQKKTKLLTLDKKDNIDLKNRKQLENYLRKFKGIDYIVNASGKNDDITKDQKKSSFKNNKI